MMNKLLTILVALLVISACGPAAGTPPRLLEAWARQAPVGQNSAIYLTIDNPGPTADRLLSASTDVAQATEIHETTMDASGVMSMHPQQAVDIPAGTQVVFKPGGLHVMLINLVKDLNEGDSISLTLNFDKNGPLTVKVPVKSAP